MQEFQISNVHKDDFYLQVFEKFLNQQILEAKIKHLLSYLIHLKIGLEKKINSIGLKAAAKDNYSDALTSISTSIAIFAASLGISWLDGVMAFIVGIMILKTAYDVFSESTFQLTDGFEPEEMKEYKPLILSHPEVKSIEDIKARRYGSNIYLDLTVCMDPNLTVWRSHEITEEIEIELADNFGINFIDIHVEPYKKARN